MRSRLLTIAVAATLAWVCAPVSAPGWANGPVDRDRFGTHDWVLDNAIRIAGDRGSWVDWQTAMLATDDPDSDATSSRLHLFRDRGMGRGSADQVADFYYRAVLAYRTGDRISASRYLGILSHYYADTLQPFHADYRAVAFQSSHPGAHVGYELAVDSLLRAPGDRSSWIRVLSPRALTDVRARTVEAAYYSRARFVRLSSALEATSSVVAGDAGSVTREVLSRASNDLADIVAAVPEGAGLAAAPATMTTRVRARYPARFSEQRTYATCTDENGDPIEGVGVRFTWRLPSGYRTVIRYTNDEGIARSTENIGASAHMKRAPVVAQVVASGASTTSSTWFMPTPPLANGTSGLRARVSATAPRRWSLVTVSAVCRDRSGRPIPGMPVTFSWKFRTKTITTRAIADARGIARTTRNVGAATSGYRVQVQAASQGAGVVRHATTWFTPH